MQNTAWKNTSFHTVPFLFSKEQSDPYLRNATWPKPVAPAMPSDAHTVTFELFSSSFCGACAQTRAVLDEVVRIVPETGVLEHNVASDPELAEDEDIAATPMVIVRDVRGEEVLRASGVPTIDAVLAAVVRARDAASPISGTPRPQPYPRTGSSAPGRQR